MRSVLWTLGRQSLTRTNQALKMLLTSCSGSASVAYQTVRFGIRNGALLARFGAHTVVVIAIFAGIVFCDWTTTVG